MTTATGTTYMGLRWRGIVTSRRGVRVVRVSLVDRAPWGIDCQWDASPLNRKAMAPAQVDMQRMAEHAEQNMRNHYENEGSALYVGEPTK